MNQSIFIAGNNPSSCLVCAHRAPTQGTPEALVLNVGAVSVNTSEGGGNGEGSDTNQKGDRT